MSDAQYARAAAQLKAVRQKDSHFTWLVFAGIGTLIVLSVVLGKSHDEVQADEAQQFREHVNTLPEQQRQRESERFWNGVGMEKGGAGR